MLNSVNNAFNNDITMSYNPITNFQNSNLYIKGSGASFPVMDFQGALFVVENLIYKNGNGGTLNHSYTYKNAKIHKEGKGFLGFMEVKSEIIEKNSINIDMYNYDPTYYFTYLQENQAKVKIGGNEKLVSKTTYFKNKYHFRPYKRIFIWDADIISNFYEVGPVGTTDYIKTERISKYYSFYDAQFGSLTELRILSDPDELTIENGYSEYDFMKKIIYDYMDPVDDNWVVNRVKTEKKYYYAPNNSSGPERTHYFYFSEGHQHYPLLYYKKTEPDDNNYEKYLYFNYDSYGNIITTNLQAPYYNPSIENRITNFEYSVDFQHRFLTKKTRTCNNVDHIESYDYFPAIGKLQFYTSINNLVTVYEYDGFGRLKKTISPDGVQSVSVLRWAEGHDDAKSNSIYYNWQKSSGLSEVLTFYDIFGREVRTVSNDFNNNRIYIDTEYDNFGRKIDITDPYIKGESSMSTVYSYDQLDRLESVILPSYAGEERITNYNYNGLETTIVDMMENETIKRFYSNGLLKEVEDTYNNITKYKYTSFGKVEEIEDPAGNVYSFEYDCLMNRNLYIDPNANESFGWKYNPFSEIQWAKKDGVNKEVFTYDVLGRIISQHTMDGLYVNYYYDTQENGIGKLHYLTHESWNACSDYPYTIYYSTKYFYYDGLGRLIKKEISIDEDNGSNEYYVYENSYDILGRQKVLTYPSGYKITSYYDNNSYLRKIKDSNGKKLWQLNDVNTHGQITEYSFGNK